MEQNETSKKKTQKKYLLVLLALVLIAIAVAAVLIALKVKSRNTWQEQYDLGMTYLDEGDYERAVVAFTKAIETEPKKAEAYEQLAQLYIQEDRLDEAKTLLETAVTVAQGDEETMEIITEL